MSSPTRSTKSRSLLFSASSICGSTSAFGSFSWPDVLVVDFASGSSEFWLDEDDEPGTETVPSAMTGMVFIVGVTMVNVEVELEGTEVEDVD